MESLTSNQRPPFQPNHFHDNLPLYSPPSQASSHLRVVMACGRLTEQLTEVFVVLSACVNVEFLISSKTCLGLKFTVIIWFGDVWSIMCIKPFRSCKCYLGKKNVMSKHGTHFIGKPSCFTYSRSYHTHLENP